MRKTVKKIVVELDLSNLDEEISLDQITNIYLEYYNIGEDETWRELVPFKIIKIEKAFGKQKEKRYIKKQKNRRALRPARKA